MQRELIVSVSRSWLLGGGSVLAVVALVVGLWVGISLGSGAQTSVVAASFDSGSIASDHTAVEGLGKVKGAACDASTYD
ncbi:MAG: hypothetical protein BZY80_03515 [SAR202 cluster bacterium Io17-Chloro-G2]|nr:MAG: hypothetical protein BZY80_03515 [SAR202 cluster bacterium Io17-Chloro-G2]